MGNRMEHLTRVPFSMSQFDEEAFIRPSYLSRLCAALFKTGISIQRGETGPIVFDHPPSDTHTTQMLTVHGMETLEVLAKDPSVSDAQYEVYCCGLGENAMNFKLATAHPDRHYILWNYPGMGLSTGTVYSSNGLYQAAYLQVMRLIDQGIPPHCIFLKGFSLGGGVAMRVARQLHEEGYSVHLEIDRSFSQLSAVAPAYFNKMTEGHWVFTRPILSLALLGMTVGVAFAGLVVSLSAMVSSLILDGVSCGPTSVSLSIWALCSLFFHGCNLIASLMGVVIALSGFIIGGASGLALGSLLIIQSLWTEHPFIWPMDMTFRWMQRAFCFDMDSVSELHRFIVLKDESPSKTEKSTQITILNTLDDELIDVSVSLNTGMGFAPNASGERRRALKEKVTSFWYHRGGHNGELEGLCEVSMPSSI